MKKALSVLLIFVFILGFIPPAAAAQQDQLTRKALVDLLITAADDYHAAQPGDIIQGDGSGDLRYDQPVTRIEALVMLKRAFGPLPALSSNRFYADLADKNVTFSDVPAWAQADIDALTAAGLLVNTSDGQLHGADFITQDEVRTLLRRVWMLFGSNAKDDFFTAHEKERLNQAVPYTGYAGRGSIYDVIRQRDQRIDSILAGILAGQWAPGSDQQKIKDYYNAALAVYSSDARDISPVQGYLDRADKAKNLSELMEVLYSIYADTGVDVAFFHPYIESDIADSSKNVLWIYPDTSDVDNDTYQNEDIAQAAEQYFRQVFLIAGAGSDEAAAAAADVLDYEKKLAAVQTPPEHYYDQDYYYHPMTLEDADARLPHVDFKKTLTAFGFSRPEQVVIGDRQAFAYLGDYLADENLAAVKNVVKYSILQHFGDYLSRDYYEAGMDFYRALRGDATSEGPQERARSLTLAALDTEIGKLYVKQYFSQADKDRLAQIEQQYVQNFKERINTLDWMSSATKAKAIAKLEAMTFKNIWPDYWFTDAEKKYTAAFAVASPAQGGSLYANYAAAARAFAQRNVALQGQPVDKAEWGMSPLEVNAFYYPSQNSVYLMAGYLDDPFYDSGAPLETVLGALGETIGHEMTHGFDNEGARFDGDGNSADWWTPADYAAFSQRCEQMAAMFDRFEAAPGIVTNGELTTGENVADLGGLNLSVEVLKDLTAQPDYKAFFTAFSRSWAISYQRQSVSYRSETDPHALAWLRVNVRLMQCQEFYDTYGITAQDGMYLPPEERVSVW